MPHLAIDLLGSLQVQLDARPVVGLDALKARALLAYLVTEAVHPQRREVLAARLWPDSPDDLARRSLSQALFTIRRALADETNDPPFLLSTRDAIQFNPASRMTLDVQVFQARLSSVHTHDHATLATCAGCLAQLETAVACYTGDFLQDINARPTAAQAARLAAYRATARARGEEGLFEGGGWRLGVKRET